MSALIAAGAIAGVASVAVIGGLIFYNLNEKEVDEELDNLIGNAKKTLNRLKDKMSRTKDASQQQKICKKLDKYEQRLKDLTELKEKYENQYNEMYVKCVPKVEEPQTESITKPQEGGSNEEAIQNLIRLLKSQTQPNKRVTEKEAIDNIKMLLNQ